MDNKIEIISMKREHISEVLRIERATFSDPWGENDFLDGINDENKQYFTAMYEGTVAGYIGYWGVLDEVQIYNVAVDERYRKKGIAKAMLERLIEHGKNHGRSIFLLEVRESNEAAIRLYQKCGFTKDGKRPNFYTKPDEDAILMSLRLSQKENKC